ncbi:SH3 domain-containing protein [Neolewinella persica]|uniref:SH3 domain-containing protein n=1 Tax=Neolewinella persica TaxID=70998 RepID=UPI00036C92AD|nr:SH3 domain-containing protein [Neolewinella persica]
MRYLTLFLLCSSTLLSQHQATSNDKYVWATSGLVLRAEGNPQGKKLAVIPYGATVQLTGEWGEDLSIDIIPVRQLDGEELPGWEMLGQFVGVRYGELKGYAFNGYISNYDPKPLSVNFLASGGKPGVAIVDTLHFLPSSAESTHGELSLLYDNGITISSFWDKVGAGETIVVPNATLAAGYLLAAKWFQLNNYNPNGMAWKNAYLINKTPDSLTFKRDLEEVIIKEYFGVVIILYSVAC